MSIDAMSNAESTVAGLVIDGDQVVAHGELRGPHDGARAEPPATGKLVTNLPDEPLRGD